jgi:hypothetical protein
MLLRAHACGAAERSFAGEAIGQQALSGWQKTLQHPKGCVNGTRFPQQLGAETGGKCGCVYDGLLGM